MRSVRVVLVLCVLAVVCGTVAGAADPASAVLAASPPGSPAGVVAVPAAAGVAVSWGAPADVGGSPLTGYVVTPSVGEPMLVDSSLTDVVVGAAPGSSITLTVAAVNASGTSPAVTVGPVTAAAPGGSIRVPEPTRLVDSRSGLGVTKAKLASGAERAVQVTGRAGVPGSGVQAVFVNVMALDVTANTSLTVWPDGGSRPATATVVAKAAERVTHMVEIPVGTGGRIRVRNGSGSTNLVLDVYGYVLTPAVSGSSTKGLVTTVAPSSLVDTRIGQGAPKAKLGAGGNLDITVAGKGGVPSTGVSAVFVNLTAFNPSTTTGLTVFPTGPLPGTQNLSGVKGTSRSNRVLVALSSGGRIRVNNQFGTVDIKVDLAGWVADGTNPALGADSVNTQTARRLIDTATGTGVPKARVAKGAELTVTAAGAAGVPAATATTRPTAVLAFVRLTTPSGYASLSLRPADTPAASIADVAGRVGQTMGNLALVPLSADGRLIVRNSPGSAGSVDIAIDIVAWLGGSIITDRDLIVLTPAQAASYTTVSATELRLGASAPPPAVGKVLAAAPTASNPKGMLRRVVSVTTRPDGAKTIATRPASISEAIRTGHLSANMPNTTPPSTSRPGASPGGVTIGRSSGLSSQTTKTFTTNPTANSTLTGTATASFGAELEIDIGWGGIKASAVAEASESLSASLTMTDSAAWSTDVDLGEYTFGTYVFFIGGIPIVVTPQIELSAHAEASAEATLSIGFDQSASGRIGFEYDGGIKPVKEFTSEPPSITGPTLTASAAASISLDVDFELEFYGTGELEIGLSGHIDARTDECDVKVSGGLDAKLGFELDVIGPDIEASYATPLGTWDLASIPIPGRCTAWTGVWKVHGSISSTTATGVNWTETLDKTWLWRGPAADGLQNVTVSSNDTFVTTYPDRPTCQSATRTILGTTSTVNSPAYFHYETTPPVGSWPGWHTYTGYFPAINGATQTTVDCEPHPVLTGITHASFQFIYELERRALDLPYTDPHIVEGSVSLTGGQICQMQSCTEVTHTGTMQLEVRMTDKPDSDYDGMPNSTDPAPNTFSSL